MLIPSGALREKKRNIGLFYNIGTNLNHGAKGDWADFRGEMKITRIFGYLGVLGGGGVEFLGRILGVVWYSNENLINLPQPCHYRLILYLA